MELEKLRKHVIHLMQTKLDPRLAYHNLEHTLDVYDSAVRLGEMEKVDDYQMTLLKTAAMLHDIGMMNSYVGHEEESVKIAKEFLPTFRYGKQEMDLIEKMVMATMLPQSGDTIEEKIICDADLDYLGRDDFNMISLRLKYEWDILGINPTTLREWYRIQVKFLTSHQYYTQSAIDTRQAKKEEHLLQIMDICSIQK
jgi:hypothetical protein